MVVFFTCLRFLTTHVDTYENVSRPKFSIFEFARMFYITYTFHLVIIHEIIFTRYRARKEYRSYCFPGTDIITISLTLTPDLTSSLSLTLNAIPSAHTKTKYDTALSKGSQNKTNLILWLFLNGLIPTKANSD